MLNENHLILQIETEEMGKVVRYYKEQITTEKIMILEIVSKMVIVFMYFKIYILNSKLKYSILPVLQRTEILRYKVIKMFIIDAYFK